MSTLKLKILLICVFGVLIGAAGIAEADWDPGDPFKMHYPQLPDPIGWDVHFNQGLADDWRCTQSGPVSDIHFWYSFQGDMEQTIDTVIVNIYNDNPMGPGVTQSPMS